MRTICNTVHCGYWSIHNFVLWRVSCLKTNWKCICILMWLLYQSQILLFLVWSAFQTSVNVWTFGFVNVCMYVCMYVCTKGVWSGINSFCDTQLKEWREHDESWKSDREVQYKVCHYLNNVSWHSESSQFRFSSVWHVLIC